LADAGKPYYLEAFHAQGGGSSHFAVAMRTPAPEGMADNRSYGCIREHQKVTVTVPIDREIQRITITGASGGTFQVAHPEAALGLRSSSHMEPCALIECS
jgi:hypothetical protein